MLLRSLQKQNLIRTLSLRPNSPHSSTKEATPNNQADQEVTPTQEATLNNQADQEVTLTKEVTPTKEATLNNQADQEDTLTKVGILIKDSTQGTQDIKLVLTQDRATHTGAVMAVTGVIQADT